MNNNDVKYEIEKMNKSTKDVYDQLILDSLLEIKFRNRLEESVLEKIILVHLSFFSDSNYLEYEELKTNEKNVYCRIISKGIASIYVDDEYITNDNWKDKLVIMEDLVNLLCFLTGFNKSTIKRLVIRDIKIYFHHGWKWDFI